MPYMSGTDLCRSLMERSSTQNIPVIILTARGYALSDEDLGIGNIKEVVSKPFSPRLLIQMVQSLLAAKTASGKAKAA